MPIFNTEALDCSLDKGLSSQSMVPTDRLPMNDDEAAQAEAAVARELAKLSLDEQEKILFDVHGIPTTITFNDMGKGGNMKEDERLLGELVAELSQIRDKPAYDRAMLLCPSYVQGQRWMFLRAQRYEPALAARVMVDHYRAKRELFGDDKLVRNIRYDDLDTKDQLCVQSGFLQISPTRDAAGRAILYVNFGMYQAEASETMHRAMWYTMMAALRDEEMQRKGFVVVGFNFRNRTESLAVMKKAQGVFGTIPRRIDSFHYCYNDPAIRPTVQAFAWFLFHGSNRFRLRAHYGDFSTIAFELQTFGIPTETCPMSMMGDSCSGSCWSIEWHLDWLEAQLRIEEQTAKGRQSPSGDSNKAIIMVPQRFDVLFGKSKLAREHPGNLRCLCIVEMFWDEYEKADRRQKTQVADSVLSRIEESGGRFLRKEGLGWVEVEHKVAREKISHFFRALRSQKTTTADKSPVTGVNKRRADLTLSASNNDRRRN